MSSSVALRHELTPPTREFLANRYEPITANRTPLTALRVVHTHERLYANLRSRKLRGDYRLLDDRGLDDGLILKDGVLGYPNLCQRGCAGRRD